MTSPDGAVATTELAARAADIERLKDGAALLLQHGNRVAALAVLWAAVAIDPVDHGAHRRLATTLASGGDLEGAAQEHARYVEFLMARGDIEGATAELHFAARALGRVPALTDAVNTIAAELPALLLSARQRVDGTPAPAADAALERPAPAVVTDQGVVQLPIKHPTRVTFYTCLHDDGDAAWFQLEGGTPDVLPERVRLSRAGEVLETRRCIRMPAGRKSHARPDVESKVWAVLRAPEEMLRAIDSDEAELFRIEALVDGEWLAVDVEDTTACRFGVKRREIRSA
jgi:hypothetical protein